jgi:FixJ family two-component response regulator
MIRLDRPLSPRETEILELVVQGKNNVEMAAALENSRRMVKWHLENIYDKADPHLPPYPGNEGRRAHLVEWGKGYLAHLEGR